jgi:hypothetical protein
MAIAQMRMKQAKTRDAAFYENWLPQKRALSVTDVSTALDISDDVVRGWIDEGKFKVLNISTAQKPLWRIDRQSLLDHLKERAS